MADVTDVTCRGSGWEAGGSFVVCNRRGGGRIKVLPSLGHVTSSTKLASSVEYHPADKLLSADSIAWLGIILQHMH